MKRSGYRWVAILLLTRMGCSGGSGLDPDAGPDTPVVVSALSVTINPRNTLSFFVTWRTDVAVPTSLAVDCGPSLVHTFEGQHARTSHDVFVMGLRDGQTCRCVAHPDRPTVLGEREISTAPLGPLPAALPEIVVDTLDATRLEPGWTFFSVSSAAEISDVIVVAVDPEGHYRWYYDPGIRYDKPEAEVYPVEGGLLLGNLKGDSQIVSWEGERQWQIDRPAHHDLTPSPFQARRMLYLGHREETCVGGAYEHTAAEIDMDTHLVVWDWWICDHWTPRLAYPGWSHLNSIEPWPGERAVLISSRNQDALFKVDRDTDELVWALGRDGDFAMDPAAWFLRQHDAEIQPDGTILLFDNGLREDEAQVEGLPPRTYSRVLQFALTFTASGLPDRADVVWEYTDPAIFATSRSGADRLPGGNTLIHYCYVAPDRRLVLREVSPAGEILWNAVAGPHIASYRSERIGPYHGHVR